MKVLSLTQPWASLVALRVKRFETRSWSTAYRGPLAIHAARGLDGVGGRRGLARIIDRPPFREALQPLPELPLGAIVAVANLTVIHRVEDVRHSLGREHERELAFGDYGDRRYAWRLDDVVALPVPVGCRGALGVWDVPPMLLEELHLQIARGQDVADGGMACRVCGCTDSAACDDGCNWVEADLCSRCVDAAVPA